MPWRSPCLAVKRVDWLHCHIALLKVCHHVLPLLHKWCPGILAFFFLILCEVSVHVFVHVCVQAKSSNGTTMETFSKFSLLHCCCTLLPFLPLLRHYVLCMHKSYYTYSSNCNASNHEESYKQAYDSWGEWSTTNLELAGLFVKLYNRTGFMKLLNS